MTIAEVRTKCKTLLASIPKDALVLAVLVLASLASFGLGFLAGQESRGGEGQELSITTSYPEPASSTPAGAIVASKNGTRYYPPGCAGADRISATNKVYFATAAAAEAKGYQLASGCKAP